jgi:hypothetical protein
MFGFGFALNALAPLFERDLNLRRDELGLALGLEFDPVFIFTLSRLVFIHEL